MFAQLLASASQKQRRGQGTAQYLSGTQKEEEASGYPVGGRAQEPGQGRAGHLTWYFSGLLLPPVSLCFEA